MLFSNVFCHGGFPAETMLIVSKTSSVTICRVVLTLSCSAGSCIYMVCGWCVYGGAWPGSKTATSVSLSQVPGNQLILRTSEKHFPQPVYGHL